jgi:S-adenosyl-L-methionine hydrolase (adenosine-forming)
VIARIAPEARVIDITHGIPRHGVRQGAVVMANAVPFSPPGIHLAVVDPGVGSDRRPVAVRTAEEDRVLVGPDNGVLALALERLGGPLGAVELTTSAFRLEPVTATFHGRDIFAPVAARLAAGAALADAGEDIDPTTLAALALPEPRIYPDRVVAHVVYVDGFGNAALNVGHEQFASTFLRIGESVRVESASARLAARFARTFADVPAGDGVVYEDSYRSLALAVNRGSAAAALRLTPDDEVVLLPGD